MMKSEPRIIYIAIIITLFMIMVISKDSAYKRGLAEGKLEQLKEEKTPNLVICQEPVYPDAVEGE